MKEPEYIVHSSLSKCVSEILKHFLLDFVFSRHLLLLRILRPFLVVKLKEFTVGNLHTTNTLSMLEMCSSLSFCFSFLFTHSVQLNSLQSFTPLLPPPPSSLSESAIHYQICCDCFRPLSLLFVYSSLVMRQVKQMKGVRDKLKVNQVNHKR